MGERFDRHIEDAKSLEAKLKATGRHPEAEVVRTLRMSALGVRSTLKTIHHDNMVLRQRLGLPSFLDAKDGALRAPEWAIGDLIEVEGFEPTGGRVWHPGHVVGVRPQLVVQLEGAEIIALHEGIGRRRPTPSPEPGWTARLAQVDQRTAIERQAAELVRAIEELGGHPLLTDAQTSVDRAMRILGAWHDQGEPGGRS